MFHIDSTPLTPALEDCIIQTIPPCSDLQKMGLLILAGGEGTRLGYQGPKGCFALPLRPSKTLFQILFEKIGAKGRGLCVAVLTSPLNYLETILYLRAHNWFGLESNAIDFVQQELVPVRDPRGELLLDEPNQIARSPAGNGKALFHLRHSALWDKWKKKGVEYVQVIPVDNALSDPFDGQLLSCHETYQVPLVLRAIYRSSAQEKVGIIGMREKALIVREYSEVSEKIKRARTKGGAFAYPLANSGIFSCSLDFIEGVCKTPFTLPPHWVKKEKKILTKTGQGEEVRSISCWHMETFIFDLFVYAKSFKIIVSDRKHCFAPLKNLFGADSLDTVLRAIHSKKT